MDGSKTMAVNRLKQFGKLCSGVLLFCVALSSVHAETFAQRLSDAALERTKHDVQYDGAYQQIAYPGGDVAPNRGVCTDVIIRSYRALGFDLQKLVHEDMRANFSHYPANWGLTRPDRNIDHRRVPNLQTFFARHGERLEVTDDAENYRPGDLVTWMIGGSLPHIGIVTDRPAPSGVGYQIVHNIGSGPQLEEMLFKYPITGHYRYRPQSD